MERKSRSALNEQVYEEAGEWFLNFRDGESDAATRGEFDGWVRRSPDHLAAYLEIAAIWNEGPVLDPEGRWDPQTLIAQAMQDTDNLVVLERHGSNAVGGKTSVRTVFLRPMPIAASILAMCLCAAAFLWSIQKPIYSTGTGEQRTVVLKDGSRIELNSRSKLRILYSNTKRAVELLEGQALFSVAKDPARPFIVSSGDTRVRAVGTQFDIYRKQAGTVVTVVEGRVAVDDGSGASEKTSVNNRIVKHPVMLTAGEQLVVTRSTVRKPTPKPANVANTIAWTQRQLAFESATLSEVAEEFNRHNERQLVISDRALFEFHISGVFSSADPASLIRFLRDRRGISVIESDDEIRVEKTEDQK